MISGHLAEDGGAAMSEAWGGVECFDWYGVGDTGIIAAEGPDHDGLYIWEDAHLVEILDPETGNMVMDGEKGNICNTVLFKDTVYPVIRFDTKDVSTILPGPGRLSLPFRRLAGFQGRSDNMIKLKGINIYPTGISAILKDVKELNGEYYCQVEKQAGSDIMTVVCEADEKNHTKELVDRIQQLLKQRLGVVLEVKVTAVGLTAEKTQINARQKPIRLIDLRK